MNNPTIAIVLGVLNRPIKHSINPINHIIHPKTGIQPKNNPNMANTNPAMPQPFDDELLTTIIFSFSTVCVGA